MILYSTDIARKSQKQDFLQFIGSLFYTVKSKTRQDCIVRPINYQTRIGYTDCKSIPHAH